MFLLWAIGCFAACIFLITRSVVDFRAGKITWAFLGIASAVVMLLTSVQSNTLQIDLPVPSN
jgi:hypothetical protein